MTRINVVKVRELSDRHLVAEYRELPRVYALSEAWFNRWCDKPIPAEYTLGKGHVTFFYDKLKYVWMRHRELCDEMRRRGFTVNYQPPDPNFPTRCFQDYWPTRKAIAINRARIAKRLAGDKS